MPVKKTTSANKKANDSPMPKLAPVIKMVLPEIFLLSVAFPLITIGLQKSILSNNEYAGIFILKWY